MSRNPEPGGLTGLFARAYPGKAGNAADGSRRTPACLSPMRFLPGISWSRDEIEHVKGCAHCQGMLAASWETRHPSTAELAQYRSAPTAYPYPVAMERHLRGHRCRRCNLILRIFESPGYAAAHAGMVGRIFRPEDLGFAAAADSETAPSRPLITLAGEDPPMEVTLWVEDGELHIRGSMRGEEAKGKVLAVDLADDSGSHLYRTGFAPEDGGYAAELRAPLDGRIRLRGGSVVVAWIEEPDEWS